MVCLLFVFIKAVIDGFDLAFWAKGEESDAWSLNLVTDVS